MFRNLQSGILCYFYTFPLECSSAGPAAGKEWEEYLQIRGLVEKIRKKQRGVIHGVNTVLILSHVRSINVVVIEQIAASSRHVRSV